MSKDLSNYSKKYNLIKTFKESQIIYHMFLGSISYTSGKNRIYLKFIENNYCQVEIDSVKYIALKNRIKLNILPKRLQVKAPDIFTLILNLYDLKLFDEEQIDKIVLSLTEKNSFYDLFHKITMRKMKNKQKVAAFSA